jgi:hypothetical protein
VSGKEPLFGEKSLQRLLDNASPVTFDITCGGSEQRDAMALEHMDSKGVSDPDFDAVDFETYQQHAQTAKMADILDEMGWQVQYLSVNHFVSLFNPICITIESPH